MTKQHYTFISGESFEADLAELLEMREQQREYIANYQELLDNIDDGTYVARGNGFCATQYSEEFLEAQINKYQSRIQQLTGWIGEFLQTKPGLRSYIRIQKKRHTPEQLDAQSERIMALLEGTPQFREAQTVMLYSSLPDEVRTTAFIEKWRNRKRVILPTVVGDDIVPVELTPDTPFAVGDFNILEPQNRPYTGGYDLIVVPGMAFDRTGNRLGRGKGYYDRFLSQHPAVPKIGICFDFQLVGAVPTEANDIRMDEVLTGK
jgi:5-formyltetrahydrofolate cyclo-ligase